MAFLVNSAGSITNGTTGNDYFTVESPASTKSTINGLAGADTIEALLGGDGTALYADAAGDKDKINISGGTYSASTIKGGAGADQLLFSAVSHIADSQLFGGDGNDTITLVNSDFKSSTIALGGGVDSATLDADFDDASIALGAGADKVTIASGAVNSATVIGGGGADSITFSGPHGSVTHLSLNGDSSVDGGGADTITFSTGLGADNTIKGKGGADIISIDSLYGVSSQILGNAGGDSIAIDNGISGAAVLVGGGSGNDTISLLNWDEASTIKGGGGKDSINIAAVAANTGVKAFYIFGGAGADTIGLGNVFDSGGASSNQELNLAFESLSESTLKNLDVYSAGITQSGFTLNFSAASAEVVTFTTGEVLAAQEGIKTTTTDGLILDASFETAGLTARVEALDASLTKKGSTVAFLVGTQQYSFIQGGTTGTDDDFVAAINTVATIATQTNGKIVFTNAA